MSAEDAAPPDAVTKGVTPIVGLVDEVRGATPIVGVVPEVVHVAPTQPDIGGPIVLPSVPVPESPPSATPAPPATDE